MLYCNQCNRGFGSHRALQQHVEHSPSHADFESNFECDYCNKSFLSERSLHQHCSNASGHPYCASCKRMFQNMNNLNQHMHSRIHVGSEMHCPFCKNGYATASGIVIHLESGNCSSGMDRAKIDNAIRQLDRNHVITNKLLTMPGYDGAESIATDQAWNGYNFECYFCGCEFRYLKALNQHLNSSVHQQKLYHCPKRSCGKEYKFLSSLVQHVESESCGVMRFAQVQKHARNGIESMVGKMITG